MGARAAVAQPPINVPNSPKIIWEIIPPPLATNVVSVEPRRKGLYAGAIRSMIDEELNVFEGILSARSVSHTVSTLFVFANYSSPQSGHVL